MSFFTPWNPPLEWVINTSKKYPRLKFNLVSNYPLIYIDNDVFHEYIVMNGEVRLEKIIYKQM
jgi:hypothetical protein